MTIVVVGKLSIDQNQNQSHYRFLFLAAGIVGITDVAVGKISSVT
jgi:hypothetical protein